jgi:hypothetical protein
MPERAFNLLLALAGVAAVALLVVLGADLARSAQRGPRWKRRLIAAGLGLLASLGVASVNPGCIWTCYVPAYVDYSEGTTGQLRARLRVLAGMVDGPSPVKPEVLQRTLEGIQEDLDLLAKNEAAGKLTPSQLSAAKTLRALAEELVQAVREKQEAGALPNVEKP